MTSTLTLSMCCVHRNPVSDSFSYREHALVGERFASQAGSDAALSLRQREIVSRWHNDRTHGTLKYRLHSVNPIRIELLLFDVAHQGQQFVKILNADCDCYLDRYDDEILTFAASPPDHSGWRPEESIGL